MTPSIARRSFLAACTASVAAALLPASALAQATGDAGRVRYEGQWFDKRLRVAGAELRLNGTGIRQVAWFKGYLAALYLTGGASTGAQAVAMPGPKRIQLRILQEVPAGEFSKAVRKGIARNVPAGSIALDERLARFVRQIDALGSVHQKDIVDLDFDPARGLLFSVNASLRGEPIPGDDFYAALLRSFVGDAPYDEKLRAGLLGMPA